MSTGLIVACLSAGGWEIPVQTASGEHRFVKVGGGEQAVLLTDSATSDEVSRLVAFLELHGAVSVDAPKSDAWDKAELVFSTKPISETPLIDKFNALKEAAVVEATKRIKAVADKTKAAVNDSNLPGVLTMEIKS